MGKVEQTYDKHEAAEYLNTTAANVFYHHYVSGNLKGGTLKHGRLMWTKAQLDAFKDSVPRPGYRERPGQQSITVATFCKDKEYQDMMSRGEVAFTVDGHTVVKVERDFNHTRMYTVIVHNSQNGKEYEYEIWNNTRLVMTPLDKVVKPE